jgi:invasion protein IalB
MRLAFAFLAVALAALPAAASEARFGEWVARCADAAAPDCAIAVEAPASGARSVRLSVQRAAGKDSAPHLILTVLEPAGSLGRPRLEVAVDGGPPLRLGATSDFTTAPGQAAGTADFRLSDGATKRLLPFLRRGRALQASIKGEDNESMTTEMRLPGFADAVAEIDARQRRTDRPDALALLIGSPTAAARAGLIRDVARDAAPEALRRIMVERDCPVWDQSEANPSFLADQSFAADLGDRRTLWAIVCASGAYNVDYALFLEDPSKAANRFDQLTFAAFVESLGWTGVDSLANVAYDPEKRRLTAFEKGRAAGDCGTFGAWEWMGEAFRMIEYRSKEECDGVGQPEKFPIIFRGDR